MRPGKEPQESASADAAATDKATALGLATQIASVGGEPQQALKAGTFALGDVNDPTAKGNSCNEQDDEQGCIFSQDLSVPGATAMKSSESGAVANHIANNATVNKGTSA